MSHNDITDTGVHYSSDVVTKEEAIAMLKEMQPGKAEREEQMKRIGYPAYTTQAGNHNIECNGYNSVFVCSM
jgi:predicted Zn-dependent protease